MRRLLVGLLGALLLAPVGSAAQDFAKLDSVEVMELRELDTVPKAWRQTFREVDACLGYRAWNRVPLDSLDIYTYSGMRTPATTTSGERRMVEVKGAIWHERGEPPELYINRYHAASVIAHELIHVLCPHCRHEHRVFDECS